MQRQVSLDIFRGLTLAAMLLVNNPGSWSFVYSPLLHAKWHGLTPTDLIFPFFMFIVGASLFHSMKKVVPGHVPWFKIIKRTCLLFIIGFLLNIFPFVADADGWRIMGVLQRIAICYGVCAILVCILNKKQLIAINISILICYWLVLLLGNNPFTVEGNLVGQLDNFIFGSNHLYQGFGLAFDPEGVLSCLPAITTTFAGYFTSIMLSEQPNDKARINKLLLWSAVALIITALWQQWFPINKALWTSTYVLVTSACAWLFLAIIIYIHDVKKFESGFEWAKIYGSNPLFIYILASLTTSTLLFISWRNNVGELMNMHHFIYMNLTSIMSPINASLVFALLFVIVFYWLSACLYKQRIFIKL